MALKAGIYKSAKGTILVMCEDDGPTPRNMYASYDENNKAKPFGARQKWPDKYKSAGEFAKANNIVRLGDFPGMFF